MLSVLSMCFLINSVQVSVKEFDLNIKNINDINIEVSKDAIAVAFKCDPVYTRVQSCRNMQPRNTNSTACYIESEKGKFFTTIDYNNTVFITFIPWD